MTILYYENKIHVTLANFIILLNFLIFYAKYYNVCHIRETPPKTRSRFMRSI